MQKIQNRQFQMQKLVKQWCQIQENQEYRQAQMLQVSVQVRSRRDLE